MKHAKKCFALLLCAALLTALAVPAFAETSDFTVTADKRMVATGESITLTAVNAPQAQAGQTVQYRWYFSWSPANVSGKYGNVSIGTTADAVIQAQAPGRDVVLLTYFNDPYGQQFTTWYWCVVEVSNASGPVASYKSSKIEIQGYYSLRDSFALPYEYLGYAFAWSLILYPKAIFASIACLFGILWSPFVALANSMEAKRVNG